MIKLTEILQDVLAEKKLCPKGRAYYNRRRAAGEKPSAYLSGRAVKVCKGLMEEEITELRQGLLDYLRQQLPNFPDYVIKDWIYKMIKKDDNINTAEGIQDWIDSQLKDLKWETKTNFPITMDIFGDKTQQELKSRIGGEIRQDVGKDIERHKTQQKLLKSQGISKEPIILFKTRDGKYELGEGWHLPTKEELNLLYLNKDKIGGFETYGYWSSSENSKKTAWIQSFSVGFDFAEGMHNTFSVRAVRSLVLKDEKVIPK
jgi:hypothetical protein